jgi:Na+-transporting NADH:ubiquinone oxidoreductase subunit NqrB
MDYVKFSRLSLKIFIGFLGLTALIAVLSVLSGKFGKLQEQILGTTLTISAASICLMSCAAFIDRKKLVKVGLLGVILSVSAAILVIGAIWSEIQNDVAEKIMITLIVSAVAFAYAFLLVLPELDDRHKWVQPITSVSIGMLALQTIIAVWCEHYIKLNDWYFRLLAVVAIIVGLETIVIPILMKLRKVDGRKTDRVVLERINGDVYRDTSGKKYRLTEIDSQPAIETDS